MNKVEDKKLCFICRTELTSSNMHKLTLGQESLSCWMEKCAESICEILFGDRFHPLKIYFEKAAYCSQCQLCIWNMDSTWRQLLICRKRIDEYSLIMRKSFMANYVAVPRKCKMKVPDFEEEHDFYGKYSYDQIIQIMRILLRDGDALTGVHTHLGKSPESVRGKARIQETLRSKLTNCKTNTFKPIETAHKGTQTEPKIEPPLPAVKNNNKRKRNTSVRKNSKKQRRVPVGNENPEDDVVFIEEIVPRGQAIAKIKAEILSPPVVELGINFSPPVSPARNESMSFEESIHLENSIDDFVTPPEVEISNVLNTKKRTIMNTSFDGGNVEDCGNASTRVNNCPNEGKRKVGEYSDNETNCKESQSCHAETTSGSVCLIIGCGKLFTTRDELMFHFRQVHCVERRPYMRSNGGGIFPAILYKNLCDEIHTKSKQTFIESRIIPTPPPSKRIRDVDSTLGAIDKEADEAGCSPCNLTTNGSGVIEKDVAPEEVNRESSGTILNIDGENEKVVDEKLPANEFKTQIESANISFEDSPSTICAGETLEEPDSDEIERKGNAVLQLTNGLPEIADVDPQITVEIAAENEDTPISAQIAAENEDTPISAQIAAENEDTPISVEITAENEDTPISVEITAENEDTPISVEIAAENEDTPISVEIADVAPQISVEIADVAPQISVEIADVAPQIYVAPEEVNREHSGTILNMDGGGIEKVVSEKVPANEFETEIIGPAKPESANISVEHPPSTICAGEILEEPDSDEIELKGNATLQLTNGLLEIADIAPQISVDIAPQISVDIAPQISVDIAPQISVEITDVAPQISFEIADVAPAPLISVEIATENHTKISVEIADVAPEVNRESRGTILNIDRENEKVVDEKVPANEFETQIVESANIYVEDPPSTICAGETLEEPDPDEIERNGNAALQLTNGLPEIADVDPQITVEIAAENEDTPISAQIADVAPQISVEIADVAPQISVEIADIAPQIYITPEEVNSEPSGTILNMDGGGIEKVVSEKVPANEFETEIIGPAKPESAYISVEDPPATICAGEILEAPDKIELKGNATLQLTNGPPEIADVAPLISVEIAAANEDNPISAQIADVAPEEVNSEPSGTILNMDGGIEKVVSEKVPANEFETQIIGPAKPESSKISVEHPPATICAGEILEEPDKIELKGNATLQLTNGLPEIADIAPQISVEIAYVAPQITIEIAAENEDTPISAQIADVAPEEVNREPNGTILNVDDENEKVVAEKVPANEFETQIIGPAKPESANISVKHPPSTICAGEILEEPDSDEIELKGNATLQLTNGLPESKLKEESAIQSALSQHIHQEEEVDEDDEEVDEDDEEVDKDDEEVDEDDEEVDKDDEEVDEDDEKVGEEQEELEIFLEDSTDTIAYASSGSDEDNENRDNGYKNCDIDEDHRSNHPKNVDSDDESSDSSDDEQRKDKKMEASAVKNITLTPTTSTKNSNVCLVIGCRKQFANKDELIIHFLKVHIGAKTPFKCSDTDCKEKFATSELCKNHYERIHAEQTQTSPENPKSCTVKCSKESVESSNRNDSVPEDTRKRLRTSSESNIKPSLNKRKKEQIVHNREKDEESDSSSSSAKKKCFNCKLCGESFQWEFRLTAHLLEHTSGRIIKCLQCDREFESGLLLNIHELTHSTQEKISCKICSEEFLDKRHLTKHVAEFHSRKRIGADSGDSDTS